MKKLLYILLFVPLALFGQDTISCDLFSIVDVTIDEDNYTMDFSLYNENSLPVSNPYFAYTIDNNGDTIQYGTTWHFLILGESTSFYNYTLNSMDVPSYPLTSYFVYQEAFGEFIFNPDTCVLIYNNQNTEIPFIQNVSNKNKLIQTNDILGKETTDKPFTPLIDMYDDGSTHKRIIIE